MTICFSWAIISALAVLLLACAGLMLTIYVDDLETLVDLGILQQLILYGGAAICSLLVFIKVSFRLNRICNQLIYNDQARNRELDIGDR